MELDELVTPTVRELELDVDVEAEGFSRLLVLLNRDDESGTLVVIPFPTDVVIRE